MQTCVQKTWRTACGFKADMCSSRHQEKKSQLADKRGPEGELIERTYDYVITSRPQAKIRHMEVVADFEPRPYKAVSLRVEREKEIRDRREQKMP